MTGRLYVGTSGFSYPGWAPRFYPAGLKGDGLRAAQIGPLKNAAARLSRQDQMAAFAKVLVDVNSC